MDACKTHVSRDRTVISVVMGQGGTLKNTYTDAFHHEICLVHARSSVEVSPDLPGSSSSWWASARPYAWPYACIHHRCNLNTLPTIHSSMGCARERLAIKHTCCRFENMTTRPTVSVLRTAVVLMVAAVVSLSGVLGHGSMIVRTPAAASSYSATLSVASVSSVFASLCIGAFAHPERCGLGPAARCSSSS